MNFLTLDLNLLRVFDAVMTEQNLTRAANLLAMTQPAVSNALKRLRDSLHDDLLIRTAHGVKPTPRAEELWPTIRRALSELEAIITPETFDVTRAQNTFRMAMVDATAALWLPSLVRTILREAPQLKIRMMPLTTRDPRSMLLRGDVDLAIGFFPGVAAQLADGGMAKTQISHQRLYTGHYVCVMNKNHPLATQEMTLDRYCAADHLLVSLSGKPHAVIDDVLASMNRERRILLTVNQFFTAGRIVASSDLITVLPRHLIAATGMTEALVVKELPFQTPQEHVDMLWHERDARNPAHKWLRAHLSATTHDEFGRIDT
ncbi:LysR family transcriptional regulator [Herbaspirillum sp. RTI4]|uniref:LysR family transcriptional regulator n=1 Tax=Herbaspirillum sp. RTI4 TaxID=3048640 RepID=UPI002AB386EC|nr:LysR family transcriptional regulator [Herbaspirillum sp. RTI4]MDY7577236.1 LysR family transcriptional regulator [Herbaspirillum sp. RTI4]MEA9980526.1 LysR family transcriptional regulator [Herbaspirillum sp. RTI4]